MERMWNSLKLPLSELPLWPEVPKATGSTGYFPSELAGDQITAKLSHAPGNNAAIGGVKVCSENGWFAARPSGTEDVYKIYAESFVDEAHLERILAEAQEIVDKALA